MRYHPGKLTHVRLCVRYEKPSWDLFFPTSRYYTLSKTIAQRAESLVGEEVTVDIYRGRMITRIEKGG
jgi:hypothetical protein